MVRQYPYTLYATLVGESYKDEHGDWIVGESERQEISLCRDEVNGSGALVSNEDGQKYVYHSIIYLPMHHLLLKPGTFIEVEDEHGELRLSGKIIRVSNDQFHTRIWV